MGIVITGGGSLSPLLRVAFFIFAAMGANAIRAGCIGSIALLFAVASLDGAGFFLALPVVVVMAIAVSLLSRRTPRSAQLTRLKRRDRGVLTGTLTWNRSLLYL